jgi:hypothetical protein
MAFFNFLKSVVKVLTIALNVLVTVIAAIDATHTDTVVVS